MAVIVLTNTGTDKLQVVMDAAVTVDVQLNGADLTTATKTTTPIKQNTAISTAATTDVLATPASGDIRALKNGTIRNRHASLTVGVTIVYNANGTTFEIHKASLLPGDCLQLIEGLGWFQIAAARKLDLLLRLASDYVNATTSFTDITGLTAPLKSGKFYGFVAYLYHINDATTTGSQFGYNIGAAPTTSIVGTIDTVTASVTASVHSAGVITARDTAVTAQTTGAAAQRLAIISGMIQPSADGTFVMRGKSEVAVAAGLTVKAGSMLYVREFDS